MALAETYAAADLVDRPLATLFSPGERLVVRLSYDQTFEGALERAGRDRLELRDVRELGGGPLTGTYALYRNEIDSVARVISCASEEEERNAETAAVKTFKMGEGERHRLKEVSRGYVYIDSYEGREAVIDALGEYDSLGVAALGVRPDGIGLLVLAAWDRVHIYDLLKLGRLSHTLRAVLSSRRVCKVLHRAGPTVVVLRRRYGVTLRNFFDTETADLLAVKGAEPRDLSRCLADHLGLPPDVLREASSTRAEKWSASRPLSERRLLYASQLATYLIPLRDSMRRSLFGAPALASERICDYVYDMSRFEFNRQLGESNLVDDELDRLVPDLSIE